MHCQNSSDDAERRISNRGSRTHRCQYRDDGEGQANEVQLDQQQRQGGPLTDGTYAASQLRAPRLPAARQARPLGRRWCGRMPSQSSVPLESRRPPTSASDSGDSPDPTPTPNPRSGRSGRLDLPPAQVTRTTFSLILSLIYVRLPGSITVYYRSLSRLDTSVWPVLDGRPSS